MDPGLEEIVAADEELRARISTAESGAKERIEAARAARELRAKQRLEAAEARLADELRALSASTEEQLQERRKRRAQWVAGRAQSAEELLPRAAELWARIVREGP